MSGPLAPYAPGFAGSLAGRGYARLSIAGQLRLMAHVSRWLAGQGLDASALSPQRAEAFCFMRRAEGYRGLRTVRALVPLVGFLQAEGVLQRPRTSEPTNPSEQLLQRYRSFLLDERGVVERVASAWVQVAALLLAGHPGLADGDGLDAEQVTAFCARELPRRTGSPARELAAALRSFLRFLHVEGLVDAPLAQAVPAVANSKGTGLPRGLPPAAVHKLLASCDRRTGIGRRDHAILLLLARLGLRAGEVARLGLDDIDWPAGELAVRGKGGRDERLPLPEDVGAAVAGYLRRGRPRVSGTRMVFLRAIAPAVGLTSTGITWVVYAACDRAGLPRVGAHRLRHSAACDMLRAGASLSEIGQVLRHADGAVGTTAIYAKVDFAALSPLARSWPGGVA
ncbi:MAG: tyrosine-type recombinase/integrase [Thermocrispum sp.]